MRRLGKQVASQIRTQIKLLVHQALWRKRFEEEGKKWAHLANVVSWRILFQQIRNVGSVEGHQGLALRRQLNRKP